MKNRNKLNPPWALPGEKIDSIGITLDCGIHRRVVPLQPDMAWLNCPRCNEAPCECKRVN
jgi:hypothetical protein